MSEEKIKVGYFEQQSDYVKNECKNICKVVDDIWYHRLTHEQIMCYIKELSNQLQAAKEENRTLERKLEFKQIDFDRAMNDFSESNAKIGALEDIIKDKNIEIDTLAKQNKQMREALEFCLKHQYEPLLINDIAQQALNQLKGVD